MNKIVTLGLGAAAVALAVFVGAQLLGSPGGGLGSQTTPTPQPTATEEPTASPEPSASEVAAPQLTQTFTSTVHGMSVSYPEGWIARAATEPWTDGTLHSGFMDPDLDVLHDPVLTDHLFLRVASQPIGDSAPEDWVAAQIVDGEACATSEPIVLDGATGLIGGEGCDAAVVTIDGRGYAIALNRSEDEPDAVAPYDRAWFEEVLATVQLHPEDTQD